MFVQVCLPLAKVPLLTYKTKKDIEIGNLVVVSYRKKEIIGIARELIKNCPIPEHKVLTISHVLAQKISYNMCDLLEKSAKYNASSISNFCKLALPIDLKIDDFNYNILQRDKLNITETYLSEEQSNSLKEIRNHFETSLKPLVLNGVTGSGKTEIYFEYIKYFLEQDQTSQILIMVPEIGLITQSLKRVKEKFTNSFCGWHSGLTPKNRKNNYLDIIFGKVRIIIGTRSSLYLPYPNLKLIIVDEEHDGSYKQEDITVYNARDMAVLRANIEKIPIILSSATPSIESYHNAKTNKYKMVELSSRYSEARLPEIHIINLKQQKIPKDKWISELLKNKIAKNIESKEQSLIFLNRRGYAPLNICASCGDRIMCKYCHSWLVEHKERKQLECHHCGYKINKPKNCPTCKEDSLKSVGPGIERIYEEIEGYFPNAKITLISSELSSNGKKFDQVVEDIEEGKYDIIIGTQSIAKGYNFPNLTLTAIVDADCGLNGGDLKSSEKIFQLLSQVGGRAGRSIKPGIVLMQTYNPESFLITSIQKNDLRAFLENELITRKNAKLPPFSKLVNLMFSAKNEEKLLEFLKEFVRKQPGSKDILVLGPAKTYISKLRGEFRYQIFLRATKNLDIQSFLEKWFSIFKLKSWIKLKVDVDPYNFY